MLRSSYGCSLSCVCEYTTPPSHSRLQIVNANNFKAFQYNCPQFAGILHSHHCCSSRVRIDHCTAHDRPSLGCWLRRFPRPGIFCRSPERTGDPRCGRDFLERRWLPRLLLATGRCLQAALWLSLPHRLRSLPQRFSHGRLAYMQRSKPKDHGSCSGHQQRNGGNCISYLSLDLACI